MAQQRDELARRHRPARPAGRGFTLIELILVIATIAVLTAIAVPRYAEALARYRVALAANRVAADLALARSNARTTSTTQVVNFGSPADGYTLAGMAAPDGREGEYVVRLSDEPYGASLGSVSFGDPPATSVRFDRFGVPDAGGTVVVTSGRYQKRIYLDVVNGRAVSE